MCGVRGEGRREIGGLWSERSGVHLKMKDNKITPDGDEGKPPDMPLPIPVSYIVDGGEWVRDFSCACHVITKPESIWCVEAMKFIE